MPKKPAPPRPLNSNLDPQFVLPNVDRLIALLHQMPMDNSPEPRKKRKPTAPRPSAKPPR